LTDSNYISHLSHLSVTYVCVKNTTRMKNCSERKRIDIQRDTDGKILAAACLQHLLKHFFFLCCLFNEIQGILTSADKGHPSLTNSKYTILVCV
jgi:hypothetical protein